MCLIKGQTFSTSSQSRPQTGYPYRLRIHADKGATGQCCYYMHRHQCLHTDGYGSSCTFKVSQQISVNRAGTIHLRDKQNANHSSVRRRKRNQSGSQSCYSRHRRSHKETCTDWIFIEIGSVERWHQTLFSQVRALRLALVNRLHNKIDSVTGDTSLHAVACETCHF